MPYRHSEGHERICGASTKNAWNSQTVAENQEKNSNPRIEGSLMQHKIPRRIRRGSINKDLYKKHPRSKTQECIALLHSSQAAVKEAQTIFCFQCSLMIFSIHPPDHLVGTTGLSQAPFIAGRVYICMPGFTCVQTYKMSAPNPFVSTKVEISSQVSTRG